MIWYACGLIWTLQIFFWGLGLTLLILPGRWRRFWPAFCGPVGLGLQSLVVWVGTHTRLPGTDSYAMASLLLPAGLLLAAWLRRRRRGGFVPLLAVAWRWGAVFALMAGSMVLTAYPFTRPPGVLTSAALGSCDAPDYAAGARVFKEFANGDRSGFLGSTEIARTMSVDNFFDFCLRINHFSPSAVIALNSTLFGRQPYELTSLFGVVLVALCLPGVFWLARAAFRFRPLASLGVTAIYGASPILGYAVYQTALGQLFAAPAVALLTWTGWQACRGPASWRRLAGWSGLLLVGDWLLFGGYNFFIIFAYIPSLALVAVKTLRERSWARAFRWSALIGTNLLVCALLVPERVMSIVERLRAYSDVPYGWAIRGFWPSGWYGMFTDISFGPAGPWAGVLAVVALGAAVGAGGWQAWRGNGRRGLLALCCTLPILFGYWYLLRAERLHHDNSSYDAFKLFTVFYPGILISLCLWLGAGAAKAPLAWPGRIAAGLLWAALLTANVAGHGRYGPALRLSPLSVGADLAVLSEVERMADVEAVNIQATPLWDALWANYFLLHKPQYFSGITYEGRVATAMRAPWDLSARFVSSRIRGERDRLPTNAAYTLIHRDNRYFVEPSLVRGWYALESDRTHTWCWSEGTAWARIDNPHEGNVPATLGFSMTSIRERHLRVQLNDRTVWEGVIGVAPQRVSGVTLDLPPETSYLRFDSPEAPDHVAGDPRAFAFSLQGLLLDLGPSSVPPVTGANPP